jgi:hypothetical protein
LRFHAELQLDKADIDVDPFAWAFRSFILGIAAVRRARPLTISAPLRFGREHRSGLCGGCGEGQLSRARSAVRTLTTPVIVRGYSEFITQVSLLASRLRAGEREPIDAASWALRPRGNISSRAPKSRVHLREEACTNDVLVLNGLDIVDSQSDHGLSQFQT